MKNTESKDLIFVSVIIPTYNRAHLITDAIDSVLNQTYTNFELIVVDDHSTDNTKEVVEHYDDERVRYLLNTRSKGAQGARNTGLYVASGDWVAMLDSDDVWLPEKLEAQVQFVENNELNIVGLSCNWATYDFERNKLINESIRFKSRYDRSDLLFKNYLGGFSTFMFKKSAAIKIGGFNEVFPARQDLVFYLDILKLGEIHFLNETLVYLRTNNSDRITSDYKKKYKAMNLFYGKYKTEITDSLKLNTRNKVTMYSYGILTGNNRLVIPLSYWFFISLFVDINTFEKYFRLIVSVKLKK